MEQCVVENKENNNEGDPIISKMKKDYEQQKEIEKEVEKTLLYLKENAKSSCSKCHGLGHKGILNFYHPIVCNCVINKRMKEERSKRNIKPIDDKEFDNLKSIAREEVNTIGPMDNETFEALIQDVKKEEDNE